MKQRVIRSTVRIPGTDDFYYLIDCKKHWWTKWKLIEDPTSHNHCPLFFETKEAAIKYIKKI